MLDTVQPEQKNKTNDSETTTKRENIQVEDNDLYSATRLENKKNDPKQQGKLKTYWEKIMLDTVQPVQQNKTKDPKKQGKKETYRQKILLDSVQPVQQKKTNDLKQEGKGKTYKHKIMLD